MTDPHAQLTIARILKVNHAGEFGAIRIYRSQIWVARRLFPDIVESLEAILEHEIEHCAKFLAAMPGHGARPCRIMSLWGQGGLLLGLLSALFGRQGIWVCTAAVEATVHRHLEHQLLFLKNRDQELHALISAIQAQELDHLHNAQDRVKVHSLWSRALERLISSSTEMAIWLSTWGESSRMARELALPSDRA